MLIIVIFKYLKNMHNIFKCVLFVFKLQTK